MLSSCTVLLICMLYWSSCQNLLGRSDTVYSDGKSQYESLVQKSKLPEFGACWKDALEQTTSGCKRLTNTMTHQLAYEFTRCFYMELGVAIPHCSDQPELCKANLDDNIVHGTYAMFFMHTRDMCFFLESQVWQEKTEETISKLSNTSQHTVEQLETAAKLQEMIVAKQTLTLERQADIINSSNMLEATIGLTQSHLVNLLQDFQNNYDKQMEEVNHVFDKIAIIERIFVAEYTGTQSLVVWLGALVWSYLATATRRTHCARLSAYVLTLVFSLLEVTYISGSASETLCQFIGHDFNDTHVCVYNCTKAWRCIYVVCNILVLLYSVITFQDIDRKISKALEDLQREIELLKSDLKPSIAMARLVNSGYIKQTDELFDSMYNTDTDDDDDDCETASDNTYICGTSSRNSSISSADTTMTSEISESEVNSIVVDSKEDIECVYKSGRVTATAHPLESPLSRYNLRPRVWSPSSRTSSSPSVPGK